MDKQTLADAKYFEEQITKRELLLAKLDRAIENSSSSMEIFLRGIKIDTTFLSLPEDMVIAMYRSGLEMSIKSFKESLDEL